MPSLHDATRQRGRARQAPLAPGLVLLTATVLSSACAPDSPATPPLDPGQLIVEPAQIDVDSLGEMVRFKAVLLSVGGEMLMPPEVRWTSSDEDIVSIGADGVALARGPGNAVIAARADGLTGYGEVAVTVGSDTVPPTLQRFSMTPRRVSVSTASAQVEISARVTDARSGVKSVTALFRSSRSSGVSGFIILSRTLGTDRDGRFDGRLLVPAGAAAGIWSLVLVQLEDQAGNQADLNQAALIELGVDTELVVDSNR